jgi:hypothetical protein
MCLVRDPVKFGRKVFDRGLKEKNIRQATFTRTAMNLLRYLREWPGVWVYPYEELVRIAASALVHKATVSGPDVDHYPFSGMAR